jgi:hypothetical protein
MGYIIKKSSTSKYCDIAGVYNLQTKKPEWLTVGGEPAKDYLGGYRYWDSLNGGIIENGYIEAVAGVYNPNTQKCEWENINWAQGIAGVYNPSTQSIEWKTVENSRHGLAGVYNADLGKVEWKTVDEPDQAIAGVYNPDTRQSKWKIVDGYRDVAGVFRLDTRKIAWFISKPHKSIAAVYVPEKEVIKSLHGDQYVAGSIPEEMEILEFHQALVEPFQLYETQKKADLFSEDAHSRRHRVIKDALKWAQDEKGEPLDYLIVHLNEIPAVHPDILRENKKFKQDALTECRKRNSRLKNIYGYKIPQYMTLAKEIYHIKNPVVQEQKTKALEEEVTLYINNRNRLQKIQKLNLPKFTALANQIDEIKNPYVALKNLQQLDHKVSLYQSLQDWIAYFETRKASNELTIEELTQKNDLLKEKKQQLEKTNRNSQLEASKVTLSLITCGFFERKHLKTLKNDYLNKIASTTKKLDQVKKEMTDSNDMLRAATDDRDSSERDINDFKSRVHVIVEDQCSLSPSLNNK